MRSWNLKRRSSLGTHILEAQIALVAKHSIGQRKRPMRQFHGIVEDVGVGGEQILVAVVVEIERLPRPRQSNGWSGRSALRWR